MELQPTKCLINTNKMLHLEFYNETSEPISGKIFEEILDIINDDFKKRFHQGITNKNYLPEIKRLINITLPFYPVLSDRFIDFLGEQSL